MYLDKVMWYFEVSQHLYYSRKPYFTLFSGSNSASGVFEFVIMRTSDDDTG